MAAPISKRYAALSQLLICLCHPSSHAVLHIITYDYIQVRQLEQLFHSEWSSHLISAIVCHTT